MSTKTDQLKSILQLLGTSATKAEVQDAFRMVIKYVQDLKASNEREWSLVKSAVSILGQQVREDASKDLEQMKAEVAKQVDKAMQEQTNAMKFIYDKVNSLESIKGDKGDPGEDAQVDHAYIIQEVLARIPKPKDGYTPIKGIDYFDGKDGTHKVGWGAHPLRIFDSNDTVIEKVTRELKFANATVTRAADGVVTVTPSGTGGSGFQAPTSGTVDGSNTVFGFATAPKVIVVDQGRAMQKVSSDGTVNWTGGTTIILTVAPVFDIYAIG